MPQKKTPKIKPGSPEAVFALQGALGVLNQQLNTFDETGLGVEHILEQLELLNLFSTDRSTLTPQQEELLTRGVETLLTMVKQLNETTQTAGEAIRLLGKEKEN